jgi:hypothetical protein
MQKQLFTFLIALASTVLIEATAQVLDPVKWNFRVEKTGENTADLIFQANLEKKWHIYSMDLPEGGPVATSFIFTTSGNYELVGKPRPTTKPEVKYDPSFDMNVGMHGGKVEFRQK